MQEDEAVDGKSGHEFMSIGFNFVSCMRNADTTFQSMEMLMELIT